MIFFRKKYYKEVPCKACDGSGKREMLDTLNPCWVWGDNVPATYQYLYSKIICKACNGKGTQTVLEKIE